MTIATMKITKAEWLKYDASNAKKRKRSSRLREIHAYVGEKQNKRNALKWRKGYLYKPEETAPERLFWKRHSKQMKAECDARQARLDAKIKYQNDIRSTLKRAARVARKMGFDVESSKDRIGKISSYYLRSDFTNPTYNERYQKIRISDHELPLTESRKYYNDLYGGIPDIIIDRAMTETRLRRLIVLAAAGR